MLELVARILRRAPQPFDLQIADVVLPYMTGTELAAHVVVTQPELPVILVSAFTPEDLTRAGLSCRERKRRAEGVKAGWLRLSGVRRRLVHGW